MINGRKFIQLTQLSGKKVWIEMSKVKRIESMGVS